MLEQIGIGLAAGISYAVTGYLKAVKKGKLEKFDPYRFIQSVFVGGLAGLISMYMGWELAASYQFCFDAGLVVFIENFKKMIWRRLMK